MKDAGVVKAGVSPVMAAVAGVIAGAGVAIAGAVALSDKSNKDKIVGFVKGVQKDAMEKRDELVEKVVEEKENIRSAAIETVDALGDFADKTNKKVKSTVKSVGEKIVAFSDKA